MFKIKKDPEAIVDRCVCCSQEFQGDDDSMPDMFDLIAVCFSINISIDCNRKKPQVCPSCVQRLLAAYRLKSFILDTFAKMCPVNNVEDLSLPHPIKTETNGDNYIQEDKGFDSNRNNCESLQYNQCVRENNESVQVSSHCQEVQVNLTKSEYLYEKSNDLFRKKQYITVKPKEISHALSKEAENLKSVFRRQNMCVEECPIPFLNKQFYCNSLYAASLDVKDRQDNFVETVCSQSTTDGDSFKCVLCSKTFAFRRYLKQHIRRHGARNYKCLFCPKEFTTKCDFERHKKCHSEKRHFQCPECPKVFKAKSSLAEHMKTHGASAYFQCPLCPKRFIMTEFLNLHLQTHSDVRNFRCDRCFKAFKSSSVLARHAVVHVNDADFACTVCRKAFKSETHLDRHMKYHREARQFQCDKCFRVFKVKDTLREHMKRHGAAANLRCPFCPKVFMLKNFLKQHLRSHSNKVWKF